MNACIDFKENILKLYSIISLFPILCNILVYFTKKDIFYTQTGFSMVCKKYRMCV